MNEEKKTIIMDSLFIEDGEILQREEESKIWGKYNKTSNINARMLFDLYHSGWLEKNAEYVAEHNAKNGGTEIDFVLDRDKIPQDIVDEMNRKYPGNSLEECKKFSHCEYSGTIGLVYIPYSSYRDICGCVGRSFESPLVMGFYPKDCFDFYEIAKTQGIVSAAIEVIKRMHDESDVKAQTTEEHNKAEDAMYASWEKEDQENDRNGEA